MMASSPGTDNASPVHQEMRTEETAEAEVSARMAETARDHHSELSGMAMIQLQMSREDHSLEDPLRTDQTTGTTTSLSDQEPSRTMTRVDLSTESLDPSAMARSLAEEEVLA